MIHIRSTVAAALLVFGGAAVVSAQQPTPAPAAQAQTAQHARGRRHGRHALVARGIRRALFKGMTLSDAEKANLAQVHQKYAPQMKAVRARLAPQLQAARAARQRGDTAALRQMWNDSGAERAQIKQLLESERNDLRAALTPENQAKFDANLKRVERRVASRAAKAWTRGGRSANAGAPSSASRF